MVPADAPLPLIVCLSAASDHEARDALGRHLLPAQLGGRLRYWHPGLLSPNADPLRTTRQQLREASLVLVLLSDRYYSDRGLDDLRGLLPALPSERLVPIRARSVAYQYAADGLIYKQALPRAGRPLLEDDQLDAACVTVVTDLIARLAELGARADAAPATAPDDPAPPQAAGASYHPRWYVARDKEERTARRRLASAGLPIVLQAPHLFGKTWLLERLLAPLRADPGWRLLELDLAALSDGERDDYGALRRALSRRVLLGCGEPPDWRSRPPAADLDPAATFSALLRRVLAAAPTPLCLSIDRADELPEAVRTGLYKQLRAFIDAGAHDDAWARLQLVLCISTTPDQLQRDPTASPFNGANMLLLDEFNDAQVQDLLGRYGLRWSPEERRAVRERVGGHPYLLRLLMDEAADNGTPVAELLDKELPPLEDYLARLDQRLPADLRAVLRRVVAESAWQPPQADYWRLHRMGLLGREPKTQRVRLRGSLYQRLVQP